MECEGDSLNSVYIHGNLNFGNFTRMVFFRPLSCTENRQSTVLRKAPEFKSEHNSNVDLEFGIGKLIPTKRVVPISHKISFLISQADIANFKEKLRTQFLTLQIFHDDIYNRAFSSRNTENYQKFQLIEKENCTGIKAIVGNEFEVMKSDLFLIQCIIEALKDSSRIMVREIGL